MRLRRNVKYDFAIYSCLIGASVFIFLSTNAYFESLDKKTTIASEVKGAINELKDSQDESETNLQTDETEELKNLDKKELIKNYLLLIENNIEKNSSITPEIIKTWQGYEILETEFYRKITDSYYTYKVNVKINNINASIPVYKNQKLSTNEYIVITIYANILLKNGNYIVKSIDVR